MKWTRKLEMILKEQGVLKKDLAQRIGVKEATLSKILQADVRMSTLERIADALGIRVYDILVDEEQPKGQAYDEGYRRTHVHGYLRIGDRIVEINSMQELKDAVTACEVNYLK